MNQHWLAVAAKLPGSVTEAGAQKKATELNDRLGLEVKYLNTRHYPRLLLGSTTPQTAAEELFLVYVGGPFKTQADAEKQCAIVNPNIPEPCVVVQPDPK